MNCDNCDDIADRVWDYLDDELDPARLADVRAHLERCTGCRDVADIARSFLAMLPEAPVPEEELGRVRTRILEALEKEGLARG